jgi:hypothetical protein
MRSSSLARTALLFSTLLVSLAAPGRAQRVDSSLKGIVLPDLAAKRDTTQHYAAYISRAYRDTVPAPLLLVLDPRGRAVDALARVAPAVERLGWVAMSSYDTRGDAPPTANLNVVNVMLADAFSTLRLDTARIYVAGLSGTANDAWIFAFGSRGHIAGIISAEAGMPLDSAWRATHAGRPPFDVALSANRANFGFDAITALGHRLAADSAPSRFDATAATGWPGDTTMSRILGWFEARAMTRHLRPFDRAFVDSVYARDSSAAQQLEAARQPALAADAWRRNAVAWAGLHDVSYPEARAAALAARPDVRRWRAERDSLVAQDSVARTSLIGTLIALRRRPGVPDLRRLSTDLGIGQFMRWTAAHDDSVRAEWAARRLSEIYAHVSYYEPEAYLGVKDPARALAVLAIASEIHPGAPEVCRERARAYALRLDSDRTLTELRCALAGDAITIGEISADPRYRFMESRSDYLELIRRKKGGD